MCLTCGCGNEDDVRVVAFDAQGQQHRIERIIITTIIISTATVITSTMITISRVRIQPTPHTSRSRSLRI